MKNILDELAIKYNTDKSSKSHNYTKIYDKYLNSIREQKLNILEIGVLNGSSLNMWSEYFPNSQIYGLDINPDCKKYEKDNIKVIIGSQDDEEFLQKNIKPIKFDLIIDDGSHLSRHQIKSFINLFESLNSDSYYIIEDTCCSYWSSHEGGFKKENTAIEYFKDKVDDVNFFGFKGDLYDRKREYITSLKKDLTFFEKNINSIHFYNSVIIIEKV